MSRALATAAFLAAILCGADAWAITKTWLGGNGSTAAQRTDWGRANNWSPAGAPGAADLALIPTAPTGNPLAGFFPTISVNTTIDQLQVMPGATVTINAGRTLTVDGGATPVISGGGTVAGGGLLQVTGGPAGGVLINNTMTLGAFTLNAPVGRNMTLPSGVTVTFNGAVNVTSSEILVGAVAGAASTLEVNGTLTVAANGTINMRAPASILRVSGTLTLTGTWVAGTSTLFLDPTANQTLNITTGAPRTFFNVTVQSDGGGNQLDADLVTPSAAFTIQGNLLLTRCQFQIGNFTADVFGNIVSGATNQSQLDFTAAGTLRVRGNVDIGSVSQVATQTNGPFATLQFNGTTPQTFLVRSTAASQYHDLDAIRISNPAGVTVLDNPNADFTVNGQLLIDAGCTLIVQDVFDPETPLVFAAGGGNVLRLENTIQTDSSLLGTTFTPGTGTVVYAGPGIDQTVFSQQNGGGTIQYYNLTIDNSGGAVATQQAAGTLTVNGTFTIQGAGSIFTAQNNGNILIRGSFVDNGTFNHSNGTVTMAGTGSIAGTAASLVFSDLIIAGAAVTDVVTAQRSFTTNDVFQVTQGALSTSGALTMTALQGMLVGNGAGATGSADLNLVGPAILAIAPTRTFSVNATDGRLTSVVGGGANPSLTASAAGTFTATVNGQANLFGLNFSFGDLNGLNFTASATIERLRNVRFTNVAAGANARHLTITSTGIDLDAPGCMFDTLAAGQFNVWAVDSNTGNGVAVRLRFEQRTASNAPGAIGGPGAGEAFDGDDDTDDNGVLLGATEVPGTRGGAMVQWVYTANIDMAGAIQGFPMPAFDWNTFTYYSTYVLMRNSSGTTDSIFVLNTDGDVKSYSFTLPGVDIVGPLFWNSEAGVHAVYFGTSTGLVYRLIDTGASLVPAPAPWNVPFSDPNLIAVTSPIVSDGTNLYFAGQSTTAPTFGVFKVVISSKTQPNPRLSIGGIRVSSGFAWWDAPAGRYLFGASEASGGASYIGRAVTSTWTADALFASASMNPPADDCTTSFVCLMNVSDSAVNPTVYLYGGELNGWMHAVWATGTPAEFATQRPGFPFRDTVSAVRGGAVLDWLSGRLFFGNDAGILYGMGTFTGSWVSGTNYFRLVTGAGAIQTMPLLFENVLYASNSSGRLLLVDANTGAGGMNAFLTYNLSTAALGDVSRDFNTGRIYVASGGGRLHSVNPSLDPTPGAP